MYMCIYIYNFGISYNTHYTVATFYLGLDSVSMTLILTLFGGCWERDPSSEPASPRIVPLVPIFAPWDTS